MPAVSEFEKEFVSKEIEILRNKISEYVRIITQTERLCVGASGVLAAFLLTTMAGSPLPARLAVASVPIFIMILGCLRSFSIGALVLDIVEYIECAEKVILDHDELGFQKTHKLKHGHRVGNISSSSGFFWLISLLGSVTLFILIATKVT